MDRGRQGQRIRGREAAGARPFAQVSLAALAQALAQSAAALTRSRLLLRARPVASIPRWVTPTQTADRARSLALLARLTGFEVGSQACAFYLDEAGGDVQAAVRAAVQGASYGIDDVDDADLMAELDGYGEGDEAGAGDADYLSLPASGTSATLSSPSWSSRDPQLQA